MLSCPTTVSPRAMSDLDNRLPTNPAAPVTKTFMRMTPGPEDRWRSPLRAREKDTRTLGGGRRHLTALVPPLRAERTRRATVAIGKALSEKIILVECARPARVLAEWCAASAIGAQHRRL